MLQLTSAERVSVQRVYDVLNEEVGKHEGKPLGLTLTTTRLVYAAKLGLSDAFAAGTESHA